MSFAAVVIEALRVNETLTNNAALNNLCMGWSGRTISVPGRGSTGLEVGGTGAMFLGNRYY